MFCHISTLQGPLQRAHSRHIGCDFSNWNVGFEINFWQTYKMTNPNPKVAIQILFSAQTGTASRTKINMKAKTICILVIIPSSIPKICRWSTRWTQRPRYYCVIRHFGPFTAHWVFTSVSQPMYQKLLKTLFCQISAPQFFFSE